MKFFFFTKVPFISGVDPTVERVMTSFAWIR